MSFLRILNGSIRPFRFFKVKPMKIYVTNSGARREPNHRNSTALTFVMEELSWKNSSSDLPQLFEGLKPFLSRNFASQCHGSNFSIPCVSFSQSDACSQPTGALLPNQAALTEISTAKYYTSLCIFIYIAK